MTEPYVLLAKEVGQTPLEVAEAWRTKRPDLQGVPLAYAGRLDPMASGALLVLIGDECKRQAEYHHLDKEYEVEILFGIHSDSGDVLGIVTEASAQQITPDALTLVIADLVGNIELPYPVFSSKTVQGKPLHTWAMENRLGEITIPTKASKIFSLELNDLRTLSRAQVAEEALHKIELVPKVTDLRKALGNDFRRPEVRAAWAQIKAAGEPTDIFYVAKFTCVCSSGTYMRTLSEVIAQRLNTQGLAFSIHRTIIGTFDGVKSSWSKRF